MTTTTRRISAAHLRAVREHLGLSVSVFAGIINARDDQVRKWEAGKRPIPERVANTLNDIAADTEDAYRTALERANRDADQFGDQARITVWRHPSDFAANHPEDADLGPRWWRNIAARVSLATGVPIVEG